jgi:hypothetical protein
MSRLPLFQRAGESALMLTKRSRADLDCGSAMLMYTTVKGKF